MSELTSQPSARRDLVVIEPLGDFTCANCGGSDDFLKMEGAGPLCLTCADLDTLVFLPAGDAALTRRAKRASTLSAVVVRWSRGRRRYERQGTLVEPAALELAEQQCLADEDARARRRERDRDRRTAEDLRLQAAFAKRIRALFPRCPHQRSIAIAQHAVTRGSGRVGRSAAGRALADEAVTLAVVASVRHKDTPATTSYSWPACPATRPAPKCATPSTRSSTVGAPVAIETKWSAPGQHPNAVTKGHRSSQAVELGVAMNREAVSGDP